MTRGEAEPDGKEFRGVPRTHDPFLTTVAMTIATARFDWKENMVIPYLRRTTSDSRPNQAREGLAWAYPHTEHRLAHLLMGNCSPGDRGRCILLP